MVIPPTFGDLAKQARDVFKKGYAVGSNKLSVKSKTSNGISLNPSFELKNDTLAASFETSGAVTDGITLKEKWTSENVTKTNFVVEDKLCKGLKCDFEVTVNASSGKKSGVVKTEYKTDCFNGTFDADLNLAGPTIVATAVGEYNGMQAGGEIAFDSEKSKLVKNTLAGGYTAGDYSLMGFVKDMSIFEGLLYHKVNPSTQIAANITFNNQSNACTYEFGAKHTLDKTTSVAAKIDGSGKSTLSVTHKVKSWAEVTYSNQLNAKTLTGMTHGISVEATL